MNTISIFRDRLKDRLEAWACVGHELTFRVIAQGFKLTFSSSEANHHIDSQFSNHAPFRYVSAIQRRHTLEQINEMLALGVLEKIGDNNQIYPHNSVFCVF